MGTAKRILAGSALALTASGIVATAFVSAFANGPNNEWAGATLKLAATHPAVSNPTAVEYGATHRAVSNPTAIEYAATHRAVVARERTGQAAMTWHGPAISNPVIDPY